MFVFSIHWTSLSLFCRGWWFSEQNDFYTCERMALQIMPCNNYLSSRTKILSWLPFGSLIDWSDFPSFNVVRLYLKFVYPWRQFYSPKHLFTLSGIKCHSWRLKLASSWVSNWLPIWTIHSAWTLNSLRRIYQQHTAIIVVNESHIRNIFLRYIFVTANHSGFVNQMGLAVYNKHRLESETKLPPGPGF